jgi:hypothetical protein
VDGEEVIVVIVSALGILAGVAVIWMAMQSRRQIRELEHRERLAMIERGLAPAPEVDPLGFEQRFAPQRTPPSAGSVRARSSGVIMISLGLAFMFFMTFTAGEPGVGLGLGGAFAVVGAGFFINSILLSRSRGYPHTLPHNMSSPPRDYTAERRDDRHT